MSHSTISLGLGLGGGKSATSSGSPGGGAFSNEYSALFDGGDDTATLADTGIATASQSAYTFSCWAKFDSVVNNSGPFTVVGGTSYADWTFASWWRIESSGNLLQWYHCHKDDSEAPSRYVINAGTLTGAGLSAFTTGQWYHLMATWSGSEIKTYVNGTLIATTTGVSAWKGRTSTNYGLIFARNWKAFYDGYTDEFAWIPTDQSAAVADIYNGGEPTDLSSSGLDLSPLFYYRMGDDDGGTGTIVTNPKGSGTGNLALNNGAAFASEVPS